MASASDSVTGCRWRPLLDRLFARRRNLLQAVELARDILADAGRHNASRGQLVEQFRILSDLLDHRHLSAEQLVGRALYRSIAEKLMALPPFRQARHSRPPPLSRR